jgi:hypothetical protein
VTLLVSLRWVRFWLGEWSVPLGLALAVIFVTLLASVAVPFGRGQSVEGLILRFGLTETDEGSDPVAVVRLPAAEVTVQLPRANDCRMGGRIRLVELRRLLGVTYSADTTPCSLPAEPR